MTHDTGAPVLADDVTVQDEQRAKAGIDRMAPILHDRVVIDRGCAGTCSRD
jgi:hypothetical protein